MESMLLTILQGLQLSQFIKLRAGGCALSRDPNTCTWDPEICTHRCLPNYSRSIALSSLGGSRSMLSLKRVTIAEIAESACC